jgi:hypothetical protein
MWRYVLWEEINNKGDGKDKKKECWNLKCDRNSLAKRRHLSKAQSEGESYAVIQGRAFQELFHLIHIIVLSMRWEVGMINALIYI